MERDEAAQMVHAVAVQAGLHDLPEPYRSQRHTTLQYGYSIIYFSEGGYRAREEGVGSLGETSRRGSYDDPGWVDDCVAVLKLGRTIECGKGVGMDTINQRIHYSNVDYQFPYLERRAGDTFDFDPDYQRGHVWSTAQREKFLGYFFENGRMPLVFLLDDGDFSTPYEVIDGKQRLTSCLMFLRGEVAAELSDGRHIWWKDFNEQDRRQVPNIKCGIVQLKSRAEVLRFYLKLNRGGVVHTDAEIARVQRLLEVEEAKR